MFSHCADSFISVRSIARNKGRKVHEDDLVKGHNLECRAPVNDWLLNQVCGLPAAQTSGGRTEQIDSRS